MLFSIEWLALLALEFVGASVEPTVILGPEFRDG
jgi:hypothetical protein